MPTDPNPVPCKCGAYALRYSYEHKRFLPFSDEKTIHLQERCYPFGEWLHASKGEGRKSDKGKARFHLMPARALVSIVDVLTYGAEKYGEMNWRSVPSGRARYFSACMRHLWAWWGGEDNDPESGLPHLAHAACSIIFLMEIK